MKKFLLVLRRSSDEEKMRHIFTTMTPDNFVTTIAYFDELYMVLTQNDSQVMFGEHNILDFDLIYFAAQKETTIYQSAIVELYPDLPLLQAVISKKSSKYRQYAAFAREKIPFPKTIITSSGHWVEKLDSIKQELSLPLVIKPAGGAHGYGISLVENEIKLKEAINDLVSGNKEFMLQEYIPNTFDYRVIVIENEVKVLIKRVRIDGSEWRNNTSLGAERSVLPVETLSKRQQQICVAALEASGYYFGGVDLVVDSKTEANYIFEVNAIPDLNEGTDQAVANYAVSKIN